MKNVIANEFANERRFIVNYLFEEHGWNPIVIIGNSGERRWVRKHYRDAVFIDAMEMRRGRFDKTGIGDLVPVDKKILQMISEHEIKCYRMMEDSTGWNFSFEERVQFYYDTLTYWNTVIQNLKPDIFVSWNWPHTINDYVLYLLCKHVYNIPVIFSDSQPYLENYNTINDDLDNISSVFEDAYRSNHPVHLSYDTQVYLDKIRSKVGAAPKHIIEENMRNEYGFFKQVMSLLRILPVALRKEDIAFKFNKQVFGSHNAQMNIFQYNLFKMRVMRNNRQIYKEYSTYVKKPDLKKKYILFAASYQPEASTKICAGVYNQSLLIIELLASVIPEDWVIYYKEYPKKYLKKYHKLSMARNKQFYERISTMKKVQMIPSDLDSNYMADHSQAVATATGTIGWESLLRGKPVLVFGTAWYTGCDSIFKIETYDDCVNAIRKVREGFIPDQLDIERYVAAVEESSEKLFVHRNYSSRIKKVSDVKYEMERIAKALFDGFVKFYPDDKRDAGLDQAK